MKLLLRFPIFCLLPFAVAKLIFPKFVPGQHLIWFSIPETKSWYNLNLPVSQLSDMVLTTTQSLRKLVNQPDQLTSLRFSQPYNILISIIPTTGNCTSFVIDQIQNNRRVSMKIRSVYLYIIFNSATKNNCKHLDLNSPMLSKYSSTKYLIDFSLPEITVKLFSFALSNGWNASDSERILNNSLEDPVLNHRLLFRVGSQYPVGITVYTPYPEFFRPSYFGNDRFACWKKLLFKSLKARYCVYDVMSAIYLGYMHNLTVSLLDHRNKTEVDYAKRSFSEQYVLNDKSSELTALKEHQPTPQVLQFLLYYPEQLVYCPEHYKLTDLNVTTWTEPISVELWVPLLILLLVISVLPAYRNWAVSIFGLFIRQSQNVILSKSGSTKLILVCIVGMVLCTLYENKLVSLTVAPPTFTTFQSIKEALEAGYKIIWWDKTVTATAEEWLGQDLEMRGITKEQISTSFYTIYDENPPTNCRYAELLSTQYTLLKGTQKIQVLLQRLENCLLNLGRNNKCFSVPDAILNLPFYWDLHGINGVWMLETLERFCENGLKNQWNDWSTWNYKRFVGYFEGVSMNRNFDEINLNKLTVIFFGWALSCLASIVVFVLEQYKNRIILLLFALKRVRIKKSKPTIVCTIT